MNKNNYFIYLIIFFVALTFSGEAATYYSRASGNWSAPATWSTSSCGGAAATTIPGLLDNVIICSGRTVTMNGSPGVCLSLSIIGTANWTSATATTNVGGGGLTLNNGSTVSGTANGALNVSGPMNIPAGATARIGNVILTVTGTTSINGILNDNSTGGSNTFADVNLNSGGQFNCTSAETYTITGNLNTYGGDFNGSATATFNIAGDFNVVSGVCDLSRLRITVAGNTVISGTLAVNDIRGTKTFNNFTVSAGGFFNSTVAEDFIINGNVIVNGSFTANNGSYTIAGSTKTISGSTTPIIFGDLICSGTYTNNASVQITRSLAGTGTWSQGGTGTLFLSTNNPSFSVSNFNASAAGNTVVYNRTTNQTIRIPTDNAYSNLTVTGNTKTLTAATTVGANLLISTSTTLATSNNNLFVGGNFSNNGTFTAGTGTVTMNGTVSQAINGTTATAFNNLTISNSSAVVSATTNFSVSTNLSIGAGAILSPIAAVIISGAGTLTGSGTARVTRIAATPDFISQYTITGKTLAGLNIDYIGAGAQLVNALNYGSLTISTNGTRTVTFPSAVVGVSNVFSPSAVTTTYVVTGNTVDFNGTVAQAVPAFTYYNLTLAGSNSKTLIGNVVIQNDITITSNLDASVSNYAISVARNWINNGTFTAQNGSVIFNGSAAQTLSGSGTTTFNQLDINNTGGGVRITSGSYLLSSVINPLNGNFNTNGQSFTMLSTASKTARIGQVMGAASLSGNFIIQRYISSRIATYADLSSTVQNTTFNDWASDLPAISYSYNPPTEYPSAYTYDEIGDAYVPVTSSSTALVSGKGYEVFLSGDFNYAALSNTTMTTVGVPSYGNKNLSGLISAGSQGFNLVGNPFASNISWASVYAASGGAGSGLDDYIEMYDYTIEDWNGYTSADGIEIGSSQGFWVYAVPLGTPTLIIPESAKTTTSNSVLKTLSKPLSAMTLKISSDQNPFSHTFKIAASQDAKDELDGRDRPFRVSPNNTTPQLYSMVEGKKINYNVFNAASETYDMILQTNAELSGKYRIKAEGVDFVDEYTCILLEDKLKNKFINIREQGIYEFEMNVIDNPNRFVIHFSKANCAISQLTSNPSKDFDISNAVQLLSSAEGNTVNFSFNENTLVTVETVNMLGQKIVPSQTFFAANSTVQLVLPADYEGLYIVSVISDKGSLVKKFKK